MPCNIPTDNRLVAKTVVVSMGNHFVMI